MTLLSRQIRSNDAWYTYQIGNLPLPIFLFVAILLFGLTAQHSLTSESSIIIATLTIGGSSCAWLGSLIPLLRRLGAPAIFSAFLPSYFVYKQWLPINLKDNVTLFVHETNFIYLYIAAVVVGSIFGMDRTLLIRGVAKIIVPLLAGSIMAISLGAVTAESLGMRLGMALPMVIIPIMAGGVGEGAIPLSLGYAKIFHRDSAEILAHLLPVVLFANFTAIIGAGLLNTAGIRWPRLTGNGKLERRPNVVPSGSTFGLLASELSSQDCVNGLLFCIGLYLAGILLERWAPLPPPVTMLLLAVLARILDVVPASLVTGVTVVGRFFANVVTYPLLFAVAIALTPWTALKQSLRPSNLVVIAVVVLTLTVTGFLVGKLVHLYPVEAALINACHTGSGGTGDVAILTAAERLELMPFAQVATRIGGAVTVTLTLLVLRWVMRGR